ncbi:hypothetical protein LTR91_019513 [Friedmanniomyces endolithicus]|nr:hypothetical protein LTR94_020788 [Friedmanniomyces endolithicus]KAK0773076.1 hypothetical protein LTR59_015419 [Friedmanniomyces endolithicus]KAK0773181.1 hypothetical protein LTR38_016666 [Friedmanniomyces endolithicus]KAK0834063.1 hypothetical protein LTR03_014640 [Friedmanniomyces endolithicus]KAK0853260.1 hypothetical protein LTS02_012045 [Friedmanniomyces endolithicus]
MPQYQRAEALQMQRGINQQEPKHTYASKGIPINIIQGAIRTESRGVFISGLNYQARTKDVECEVQKDASNGKSKGKATIQYSSAAGAQQAIDMFDETRFMSMVIRVRLGTEGTPVRCPLAATQARKPNQPIIVNGS